MVECNGILRAQQFSRSQLEKIFTIADQMANAGRQYPQIMNGKPSKLMITLFYEPSSRTRVSFEAAMHHLGGNVISIGEAKIFSSKAKGESLEDSIRTYCQYEPDVIVLRYDKEGGAERAQAFSDVPIINAGDGTGQHPTQALLDLYTILGYNHDIRGMNIAMVGDLLNGRTVRSLCYFLAKHYPDNHISFISPEQVRMKDDIKSYLDECGMKWSEENDFANIGEFDVIYQTRVQVERFAKLPQETPDGRSARIVLELLDKLGIEGITAETLASVKAHYGLANGPVANDVLEEVRAIAKNLYLTPELLPKMRRSAIIMHPLPRVKEISYGVDANKRAVYFPQVKNGMYIRMALLQMLLIDKTI